MTETRTFAGIKVVGDRGNDSGYPEQYSLDQFLTLFNALVQHEHVQMFGWHQYTPYFNDGDECVFGAGSLWVITDADEYDPENEEFEDGVSEYFGVDYGEGTLGKSEYETVNGRYVKVYEHTEPWVADLRVVAKAFESALEAGHFDNVLLENFGNHVELTVTKNAIEIEFYNHD